MTRVSPGLEGGECGAESGPGAAGAGGFDDHLAAAGHGQGVELHLVVLSAAADAGVADPDGVGVDGGGLHVPIVP
jgi:hypothetical protein